MVVLFALRNIPLKICLKIFFIFGLNNSLKDFTISFLLLHSLSNSFVFYLTSRLNLNKGSFISHLMSILIIENLPKSWRMNRTHLHSTIALLFLHNEN